MEGKGTKELLTLDSLFRDGDRIESEYLYMLHSDGWYQRKGGRNQRAIKRNTDCQDSWQSSLRSLWPCRIEGRGKCRPQDGKDQRVRETNGQRKKGMREVRSKCEKRGGWTSRLFRRQNSSGLTGAYGPNFLELEMITTMRCEQLALQC